MFYRTVCYGEEIKSLSYEGLCKKVRNIVKISLFDPSGYACTFVYTHKGKVSKGTIYFEDAFAPEGVYLSYAIPVK